MAVESFLINPLRLGKGKRRARRKGGLPGRLLSRMMRTYGPRKGMSEAWRSFRRGVRKNEPGLGFLNPKRGRVRKALKYGGKTYTPDQRHRAWYLAHTGKGDPTGPWTRETEKVKELARAFGRGLPYGLERPSKRNPFGEEVMIVGANPRRRRLKRRIRLDNNPRKKRVRRSRVRARRVGLIGRLRRRFKLNENPRRYRRRRVSRGRALMLRDNPRRYRVRRFRSNPRGRARAAGVPALSIARPMSILMPVAVGTAAYLATEKVPAMVGMTTTLPRLGVKAAVGVGGGMLIGKFLGKQNGAVWLIGSGINLLNDILNTYVFKTTLAGFGAFPYSRFAEAGGGGVGAYPGEVSEGYPTSESYPM